MTFIAKPKVAHPSLPKNALGFTRRDYEGALSTLCAGCGHDSITAAIVEASWALALEPQNVVKLSGIGCSSKTTAYFVSGGHGFNSVHGRMPSIAMGANAANRRLFRGAQLLGRPAPARAAHSGGPEASGLRAHRRALPLRDLQRSRGLDQELRLHARALRARGAR